MARSRPLWRWLLSSILWNVLAMMLLSTTISTGEENRTHRPLQIPSDKGNAFSKGSTLKNVNVDFPSSNKRASGKHYKEERQKFINHIGIEEEEAAVLESICVSATGALRATLRFVAVSIRRIGDTIAGILSGTVKAVAGAFKLSADGIWIAAMRLAQPRAPDDRMPHLFDHAGRRVAKILRTVANVFYGVSEACILTGETTEALTTGLGQAVQDSFSSLEFLCSSLQRGLTFLLDTHSDSYTGSGSGSGSSRDDFHHQKRLAVLHADTDKENKPTASQHSRGKLPLKLNAPLQGHSISSDQHSQGASRVSQLSGNGIENDTPTSGNGNLNAKIKITSNIVRGDGEVGTDIDNDRSIDDDEDNEDDEDDDDDEMLEEEINVKKSSPSSSWFPHYFYSSDRDSTASSSSSSSSCKGKNGRVLHSLLDLRPLFHTIGSWERYFSYRQPSEFTTYFDDIYSMLLLLVHILWSWVCGPWTSHSTSLPPHSTVTASWSELMGLHGGSLEPSHTGPQLFFCLIIVAVASSIQYTSIRRKIGVILFVVFVMWLFLMASEHVERNVLATRTAVSAVNSLMLSKVARSGIPPRPVSLEAEGVLRTDDVRHSTQRDSADTDTGGSGSGSGNGSGDGQRSGKVGGVACSSTNSTCRSSSSSSSGSNIYESSTEEDKFQPLDFETSIWVNVIMSSLWGVERNGGLGPYISQSIQQAVNDELALVPPGIANIQLKRFTLGTQTPVIQAVKVHSKRASICITPADQPTHWDSQTNRSGYSGYKQEIKEVKEGIQKTVLKVFNGYSTPIKMKKTSVTDASDGVLRENESERARDGDGNGEEEGPKGGSPEWSQWQEWQSEWDRRHTQPLSIHSSVSSSSSSSSHSDTSSQQSTGSTSGSSSSSSMYGGRNRRGSSVGSVVRRPGGGSGCERLVVDMDLSYVSRDMDIVLTLRSSDVQSVLPEATVTLSGVVLAGVLRVDAELTPDYPFIGNATVSVILTIYNSTVAYSTVLVQYGHAIYVVYVQDSV